MTCKCISCPACEGNGNVWFAFDGTYLGNSRCDDFDELETCEECEGTGTAQICEECYYEMMLEHDNQGRDCL